MAIAAVQTRKGSVTRGSQHNLHQRGSPEFVVGMLVGKTVHFHSGAAILWSAMFGIWQKMQISALSIRMLLIFVEFNGAVLWVVLWGIFA